MLPRRRRRALDGEMVGKRFAVASSFAGSESMDDDVTQPIDFEYDDRDVEFDCLGDLNFDRVVDSADIGLMLGEWGVPRSIADLDRNGTVDSGDLGLLLGAFGACQ